MRRHLLDVLLLLTAGAALAGCTAVQTIVDGGTPPAAAPLVAADLDTLAEVIRLEDRRELDSARVRTWLEATHPEVRRWAARAVGRIGDRAGSALLLDALQDPEERVRAEAAFALGELGDTSAAVIAELVDQVWRAEGAAGSVEEAVEAVGALGKLGSRSETARAAVAAALGAGCCGTRPDGTVDSAMVWPAAVTAEALLAAFRLPRGDTLLHLVRWRLAAPDAELRWRAAFALFRWGAPAASAGLLERLADPEPLVRALAAAALRAAIVDSAGARAPALAALMSAATDPHPHVRISALRSLATFRDSSAVPVAARLLEDADANVALAAAGALAYLGSGAASALEQVVSDRARRVPVRGTALASLVRVAPQTGVRYADEWLDTGEPLERIYAAHALAAAPWPLVSARARRLLSADDPRIAAAGVQSVAAAAPDTAADAHAFYLEALVHADPVVRAAALGGLSRRPQAADLPVLLQAYERAQEDRELNDAAVAAVDALGALARAGVPVARSFFLRFPASDDPVVRAQVAARLGAGSWGAVWPIDTGRDTQFYRSIIYSLVVPALRNGRGPTLRIATAPGAIVVELLPLEAPLTVHNMLSLAARGYFDGGRWHRVVPNFVLQDGDPRGDGFGGPGYSIRDEINRSRYLRGAVGMALSGADTGGSQFFITHAPQPHLDGGFTIFGRVVGGMDVADAVVQDDPIHSIQVVP